MSESLHCEHILDGSNKPVSSRIIFALTSKEVLNSNSLPNNTFLLGKTKRAVREKGALFGSTWHTRPHLAIASVELSEILKEKNYLKTQIRKGLNKEKVPTFEQLPFLEDVDAQYEDEVFALQNILDSEKDDSLYLYDSCTISVGCSPPTKRIVDPPNFYPTIKPLVDGLTDALWWEDDNFNYITSTEFHYVKPNKSKQYVFHVDIVRNENIKNIENSENKVYTPVDKSSMWEI